MEDNKRQDCETLADQSQPYVAEDERHDWVKGACAVGRDNLDQGEEARDEVDSDINDSELDMSDEESVDGLSVDGRDKPSTSISLAKLAGERPSPFPPPFGIRNSRQVADEGKDPH